MGITFPAVAAEKSASTESALVADPVLLRTVTAVTLIEDDVRGLAEEVRRSGLPTSGRATDDVRAVAASLRRQLREVESLLGIAA